MKKYGIDMKEKIASIKVSNRKEKKYMVIVRNLKTKKERIIHFGARDYQQYRDSTKIKRYASKNHGDKDLKDCIWGKYWLQNQDYIKSENIGIIGGSYGGYMTMAAMTFEPEVFNVGVNIYGVTNWIRTLRSIPAYWESSRKSLYKELGDPYSKDSIRLYEISPLFHAKNIKNPIMVLQGANDPRVLQIESDEIVKEARDSGVYVEYLLFDDEGHGFIKKENQIEGYKKILNFLNNYLNKI